jgi:hypothetical protein
MRVAPVRGLRQMPTGRLWAPANTRFAPTGRLTHAPRSTSESDQQRPFANPSPILLFIAPRSIRTIV